MPIWRFAKFISRSIFFLRTYALLSMTSYNYAENWCVGPRKYQESWNIYIKRSGTNFCYFFDSRSLTYVSYFQWYISQLMWFWLCVKLKISFLCWALIDAYNNSKLCGELRYFNTNFCGLFPFLIHSTNGWHHVVTCHLGVKLNCKWTFMKQFVHSYG